MECLTQLFRHVFVNLSQRMLGSMFSPLGSKSVVKLVPAAKLLMAVVVRKQQKQKRNKKIKKLKDKLRDRVERSTLGSAIPRSVKNG